VRFHNNNSQNTKQARLSKQNQHNEQKFEDMSIIKPAKLQIVLDRVVACGHKTKLRDEPINEASSTHITIVYYLQFIYILLFFEIQKFRTKQTN
jgi:hypothetical protein